MSRIETTFNPENTAMVPVLTVRLLGAFSAAAPGGAAIKLPKKAQALLCYLIANRRRAVPRDEAATLLWSNTDGVQARQSLRQCVSVLRKMLPPQAASSVKADEQTVRLCDNHRFDIDLVAFEHASVSNEPEELVRADALYRGDLLSGVHLKHEPFEDWVTVERQRLLLLRLPILERLVRLRVHGQDFTAAVEFARRLVALDRYREESVRLLMEVLAVSDQRATALVEHARIERLLRDDLGLSPDATTRALAERIKRGWVTGVSTDTRRADEPSRAGPAAGERFSNCGRSLAVPVRPRVMVHPFDNLTGRRRHGDMAHAITQDIASEIARDHLLDVSFVEGHSGWGGARAARHPAESAYAISGSLRSDGEGVRIVAQLTNVSTGRLLWSHSFGDAPHPSLQPPDRRCAQIAARVSHAVRSGETERTRRVPAERLGVYHLCLRAVASMRNGQVGNAAALRLVRQVLALDPDLGIAHGLAARCFHVQRMMGWLSPDDPKLAEGVHHANTAVALGDNDPEALWMAGLAIMNIDGDLMRGRRLIDESLVINPNAPNAWIAGSFLHDHLGNADKALDFFGEAEELNPFDASHHIQHNAAATANFIAGDYEAAHAASEACLTFRPGYTAALRIKVATSSILSLPEQAERAVRQLRALEPGASISRMRDYWRALAPNAPHALDAKIDGWRRAGMPE
jgi:DNA-binding SARP family transcriptional activator/TolB-like protein